MIRICIAGLAGFILLLAGCGGHLHQQCHTLPQAGWAYTDSLVTQFPALPAGGARSITLDLTLTQDYPWQNLYLKAALVSAGSRSELVPEYALMDSAGAWFVQPDMSGNYTITALLSDSTHLDPTQQYSLVLRQYMRADTLKGIAEVCVQLD